jgi:HAD superfamily hydrolase (TIGR01549 family)
VVEHDLEASCVEFLCAGDSHGLLPRDELFASLRGRYGVTASVEELVLRYRADYPRYFEPDPDVRAALTALRADGWKIGIVTNGPTSQNAKVANLRLGDLVDGVCVSADVGVNKPDRRIFDLTAARCGVPLDGWMVGDSADTDIVGGRAAGLRTVWLHHGRIWERSDLAPDAVVATVEDAVRLITGRA